MHLSDRKDLGTVPSLAAFIDLGQELWYESKGLRASLDLGRVQEMSLYVVLHCI